MTTLIYCFHRIPRVLLLLAIVVLAVQCHAEVVPNQAVAYQIDAAHTGNAVTVSPLVPPLRKWWSVPLSGPISYPLIAEGKVFVTVGNTSEYGTKLYALEAKSGVLIWGPLRISGSYFWSNAAYDAGRLFVVNFNGVLNAYSADTGTQIWSRQLPGQYAFSSPPTATGGNVYVGGAGSGGTLYAVRQSDGYVLWTAPVSNGDHSSPAVGDGGIFVSYACAVAYRFNLAGARTWTHSTYCSGGGGRTPVYYNGRVYVRDWALNPNGFLLNGMTGAEITRFTCGPIPAFLGDLGFFLDYDRLLEARALDAVTVAWSFAGDGQLSSAPLIVNGYLYIGSASGNLYALDPLTGHQVWTTNVGAGIPAPDEHNVSKPLTGMAAGEDMLIVPAGNVLHAYGFMNHAPTVQCGASVTAEAASNDGADVALDGLVGDLDGDELAVSWMVDGVLVKEKTVPAASPPSSATVSLTYTYPLGTHEVTVIVSDGQADPVNCTTSVTVQDTTPPVIDLWAAKSMLIPANHFMVDVGLVMDVSDLYDSEPRTTLEVYSDEDDLWGENKGGSCSPDAKLDPGAWLRAECLKNGDGRVYLLIVKATDSSDNSAFNCCTVAVPRSHTGAAVEAVQQQAAVTEAYCRSTGGLAPPGYHIVGDGPVVGPKQ